MLSLGEAHSVIFSAFISGVNIYPLFPFCIYARYQFQALFAWLWFLDGRIYRFMFGPNQWDVFFFSSHTTFELVINLNIFLTSIFCSSFGKKNLSCQVTLQIGVASWKTTLVTENRQLFGSLIESCVKRVSYKFDLIPPEIPSFKFIDENIFAILCEFLCRLNKFACDTFFYGE